MSSHHKRLFVAVSIGNAIAEKLSSLVREMREEAPRHLKISWSAPENHHLTLKFLGQVPESRVAEIQEALELGVRGISSFSLRIEGVGAFPPRGEARVIWAGAVSGASELEALAKSVERELAKLGFEVEERSFTPHLTLGRVKQGAGARELLKERERAKFGEETVDRVILYESILKPEGALHVPLFEARLGAGETRG